ncbi:hypothetical protein AVEN_48797-1 [Araneus ventricosus]|uniref:Uncharacterized protein n=1 Tax=Araneus ventricosus TaxID=182803 RepID=A0A4Y2IG89_ARAVE|nr:hypothetical protein AVEN_48797-1 [Araneus ventricosus]
MCPVSPLLEKSRVPSAMDISPSSSNALPLLKCAWHLKPCYHDMWLGKPRVARGSNLRTVGGGSLGSARVNRCTDAV